MRGQHMCSCSAAGLEWQAALQRRSAGQWCATPTHPTTHPRHRRTCSAQMGSISDTITRAPAACAGATSWATGMLFERCFAAASRAQHLHVGKASAHPCNNHTLHWLASALQR